MAEGTKAPAIRAGTLVENSRMPAWGPGKVVALSGNTALVHFRDAGSGSPVRRIQLPFLAVAGVQSDPVLDLVAIPKEGGPGAKRPRAASKKPARAVAPLAQTIEAFLRRYPGGFQDAAYLEDERGYKWSAHERWAETLGGGRGEALLAAGDVEAVRSLVLAAEGPTNYLHPVEKAALRDAISDPAGSPRFLAALLALAAEEKASEAAFTDYVASLAALETRGKTRPLRWTLATVLPAIARPDLHFFVKPDSTRLCALRLPIDLLYAAEPRWVTYRRMLEMGAQLLEALRPHGARDLVDVQSFAWVTREEP